MTTAAGSWGTAVGLYRSNTGNMYVDRSDHIYLIRCFTYQHTWQVAVDLTMIKCGLE